MSYLLHVLKIPGTVHFQLATWSYYHGAPIQISSLFSAFFLSPILFSLQMGPSVSQHSTCSFGIGVKITRAVMDSYFHTLTMMKHILVMVTLKDVTSSSFTAAINFYMTGAAIFVSYDRWCSAMRMLWKITIYSFAIEDTVRDCK